MVVNPNIRVHPTTVSQQNEVYLARHPLNPNIMYGAAHSFRGSFLSAGTYVTTDGGDTWFGSDTMNAPNLNDQRGDPAPAIDKNGRFHYVHLTSATNFGGLTGLGANYSTDNGNSWSATFQIVNDANTDKELSWTDDAPASPYYGNVYTAWTSFGTAPANGRFSRSTDGGVTWSPSIIINATPAGHNAQGHDGRVGPNGDVYVCWSAGNTASPFTEDFIGFAKSTNGGATFTPTENAFDVNGSRSVSFNGWAIRTNSFPRIDVDKTGGSRNGWIYIVTSEINLPPSGSDADIILHRSTDGGATWSSAIRVNQDLPNNGKVQFFPVVRVDESGGVNVAYYDNRNFPSVGDSCDVYLSRSVDGGDTWTDIQVTDHHFRPKNTPGVNTMGDYIGLTSGNGRLYPFWMDDFVGATFHAWFTSVVFYVGPLTAYNIQTPAAGTKYTTLPNSSTSVSFTWDTSATGATYKWIFGSPSASARQLTLNSSANFVTRTLGSLDNMLAGIGLNPGDSLIGQWDVWAYRNNPPANDSMKAANGPRSITLKRGVPALIPFSLVSPVSGTTIVTDPRGSSPVNFVWRKSGEGINYRWKFASPSFSSGTVRISMPAGGSGFDSTISFVNSGFDNILAGLGLNRGDSIVGQWRAYGYRGTTDSLASTQTFAVTLKRQARGDVFIAYDSSSAACRTSRDSVIAVLNARGKTYELFNRETETSTASFSMRGFGMIFWLGEATSTMGPAQRDSVKAYLNSGTSSNKAKLIIFAEDIAYQHGRAGSLNLDLDLCINYLAINYIDNRPPSGAAQGLIGLGVNTGIADSTIGSFPDVISTFNPAATTNLYSFRSDGTINAIGRKASKYTTATFGVDIESLRPAVDSPPGISPARRMILAAMAYVDTAGTVGVHEYGTSVPVAYELTQNYPNPFNPTTQIKFALPQESMVRLTVFNILGQEVATLVDGPQPAGYFTVQWDGQNTFGNSAASGVYFFKLKATATNGTTTFANIKKMLLLK
jgi:hypothetical protein